MKMPYKSRAVVPENKLVGYLLSPSHDRGKHKARMLNKIGFDQSNRELLRSQLIQIAQSNDVEDTRNSENNGVYYGKGYGIAGILVGPKGTMSIKTGWVILQGKRTPSLVTVSRYSIITLT